MTAAGTTASTTAPQAHLCKDEVSGFGIYVVGASLLAGTPMALHPLSDILDIYPCRCSRHCPPDDFFQVRSRVRSSRSAHGDQPMPALAAVVPGQSSDLCSLCQASRA
eukprot:scaffold5560_cov444-Prasinococcus_capsulatus_cf.AAC.5